MRKTALIISMVFLYCTVVFAQKIDKATFEKWVDYANCKYTVAYIETFRNDVRERCNFEKYDRNVKEKLTDCTFENPVTFADLSTLLKNNGWEETENKLSAKINDKKQQFQGNEMDAAAAIGLLKLEGNFATILQTAVNDLQHELTGRYRQQTPQKEKPPVQQQITTEITKENPSIEHSHKWLWIALIATWICLVVLLTFFLKEYIKKITGKSKRIKKKDENPIAVPKQVNSSNNTPMFEDKIQSLEKKLGDLQEKVNNLDKKKDGGSSGGDDIDKTNKTVKYLKGKSGNAFSIVSDTPDGCFFKLVNEKDDTAEFEYCGTIEDARSQFNSIFDNVCETIGSVHNAKSVKTIQRGKIKFIDGKWEVLPNNKARIKFE
jgi:hypothetical protein